MPRFQRRRTRRKRDAEPAPGRRAGGIWRWARPVFDEQYRQIRLPSSAHSPGQGKRFGSVATRRLGLAAANDAGVLGMALGRRNCCFVGLLFTAVLLGCSSRQKSGRPDIDAIPEIEHRGAATKSALYEFRAKVRKRGAAAVKQDLPDLIENVQ